MLRSFGVTFYVFVVADGSRAGPSERRPGVRAQQGCAADGRKESTLGQENLANEIYRLKQKTNGIFVIGVGESCLLCSNLLSVADLELPPKGEGVNCLVGGR